MSEMHCPGQDMRNWKPEDIRDVVCSNCGKEIEIWKDEPIRLCKSCGLEVKNPGIDMGCAEWCKNSELCLSMFAGKKPKDSDAS